MSPIIVFLYVNFTIRLLRVFVSDPILSLLNMRVKNIIDILQEAAPLQLQESYDNSGLIVGDPQAAVSKVLLCVDVNEQVVEEARARQCELIVSHHPVIFKGLKKLVPATFVERTVIAALRNNIAIAAMHTNLDNVFEGVNNILAKKLGLSRLKILQPIEEQLHKLVTFVPLEHAFAVRDAMFEAGAGHLGNYDACSFSTEGLGTFRANENAQPFVGKNGELHTEKEMKIEVIVPAWLTEKVKEAMILAHPYEEVAFDIFPLKNNLPQTGAGMLGYLDAPMSEADFMQMITKTCFTPVLRHSPLTGNSIQKVAVCGGSGAFLLGAAKRAGADAFVTSDLKYHDFHDADGKLLMVDAGHYETEQFTKELMAGILTKKIPNFAVLFSEVNTNAVGYYFK